MLALLPALTLSAGAASAQAPPSAATVIDLAERVLQHAPGWKASTVVCERPRTSPYRTRAVLHGRRTAVVCEWVRQSNLSGPPVELDTISTVSGPDGRYLFSDVKSRLWPSARPATCRVEPAAGGFHTRCRPAAA